jgi:regulator of protease activity HflC (stomatin/prohibitin superfamily)
MKNTIAVFLLFALVLVASNTLFVVRETERAVLLQFGELVDPDISPGLHAKLPWVNRVVKFDGRIQTADAEPERFLTLEQKALMVDSYAKFRIVDVGQFYVANQGDLRRAQLLLAERINDGLRDQFGARTLQEVVAGERDALMVAITGELNETTARDIGIEVIDVRVKRIDLPDDVRSSVYERMTTERNREAQELRSPEKNWRSVSGRMQTARSLFISPKLTETPSRFEERGMRKPPEFTPGRTMRIRNFLRLPEALTRIARPSVLSRIFCLSIRIAIISDF